jgi:choline dehydrogenase-like flavoprotein
VVSWLFFRVARSTRKKKFYRNGGVVMQTQSLAQIVIVGGGFGGLSAAKELAGKGVCVTLIDKTNHHLFQPLLYQVATACLSPADIAQFDLSRWIPQPAVSVISSGPAPILRLTAARGLSTEAFVRRTKPRQKPPYL